MEAILAGMVEGVLVVNEQGRLQLVNDAARRMLQLEDGRDRPALPRDRSAIRTSPTQIADALRGRAAATAELTLTRDPGRTYRCARRAGRSPGGSGAVLVLHDITDLRRADRIRRDFVANVSHELRTPLTAIRGYVEALLDGGARADADARGFLEIIARHTPPHGAAGQGSAAPGAARRRAGAARPRGMPPARRSLFTASRPSSRPRVEARRQQIVDRPSRRTRDRVAADPAKLHDVLRNLVRERDQLRARGHDHRDDGDASRRRGPSDLVSPTGPGHSRGGSAGGSSSASTASTRHARARDPGGTGLGLAIVKHLVEPARRRRRAPPTGDGGGAIFTCATAGQAWRTAEACQLRSRRRYGATVAMSRSARTAAITRPRESSAPRPRRSGGHAPAHGGQPRVAPTPTMAPVMVCVVLTGTPRQRGGEQRHAPRRSRRRSRRPAAAW